MIGVGYLRADDFLRAYLISYMLVSRPGNHFGHKLD
ncbi:hypothetical protein AVEN_194064-1, partial [Araneus ventricosus]